MNSKVLYKRAWPKFQKNFNPNHTASLVIKKIAIGLILFYKGASFFQKGSCKHRPTCSDYSLECFQKFSPPKALYLTIKRIVSCNPLSQKPFYDPVP